MSLDALENRLTLMLYGMALFFFLLVLALPPGKKSPQGSAVSIKTTGSHVTADAPEHPMQPTPGQIFDNLMSGYLHEDCGCWRMLHNGDALWATPPMDDDAARVTFDMLERGEAVLIDPRKGVQH